MLIVLEKKNYVSETFLAYALLTNLTFVAPVKIEQIEFCLAARKAHFAFGHIVEQLIIE